VARRQGGELHAAGGEKRVGPDQERVGPLLHHACEGRIDLAIGAGGKNFDLPPNGRSRRLRVRGHGCGSTWNIGIDEHGKARGRRVELDSMACGPEAQSSNDHCKPKTQWGGAIKHIHLHLFPLPSLRNIFTDFEWMRKVLATAPDPISGHCWAYGG
jgi:hypothetical protein